MISKHFTKTQNAIGVLIIFCIFLQLLRVQLTQEFFFSFLFWNLFLATVPYLISEKLKTINIQKTGKLKLLFFLGCWLVFLPNAPYIITDFIHLQHSISTMIWYDMFLLFSFANTGLLLAIISITDVYKIIIQKWNQKIAQKSLIATVFLCGFGIYLGRFLRFNTWDLLTSPISILKRSLLSLKESEAWFITIGFGTLLWMLFTLFKTVTETKTTS